MAVHILDMRGPLTAVSVLCALSSLARADASLSALHGEDLTEGAYGLTVDLRGLAAQVEIQQTFVNAGKSDVEALYAFDLPSTAVVNGAAVALGGKRDEVAFGADTTAALTNAPGDDDGGVTPDVLLIHAIGHSDGDPILGTPDLTRYELRLYPIPAGKAVTVRTRVAMPLEVADGRVILRLPARGDAANLSREIGAIRLHPVGGIVGYDHVHVDADEIRGGGTLAFAHGRRGALEIDATPRVHGTEPLVWFDTRALDARHGTIAVSMFVPRPDSGERLPFERIVVAVDTSRSMDGAIDASARVVDAVLANAPPSAQVRAILFDRNARAIGDAWRPIDAAARADLGKAIRGAALANGTSVADALSLAGAALGDATTRTLVLVVTDGLLPTDSKALDLAQRLGAPRAGLTASFVLVSPDKATLPDILHGPLADLANRTGGMVLATRAGEVTARTASIARELGHAAPLRDLALTGVDNASALALPDRLAAGGGAVALGWYEGAVPSRVVLGANRADRELHVTARRIAAPELADVALADLTADNLAGPDGSDPSQAQIDAARELVLQMLRRRAIVTDPTSLVAIDSRSRFAVERRKLAVGGGPFTRVPPPGESMVRATVPQVRLGTVKLRGELDARLIHGMLETGLLPRARACFQPLLLRQRAAEGTVHLDLELSRGEVTDARVSATDFPADVSVCLLDAVNQLDVPRTVVDDVPDTVYVVHYPLTFRSLAGEIILPGDADSDSPIDTGVHAEDADKPLGATPQRP